MMVDAISVWQPRHVDGDGGAFDVERSKQFRYGGDLVRLIFGLPLPQHQPGFGQPCAHGVNRRSTGGSVEAPTAGLAIYGDVARLRLETQRQKLRPRTKDGAERLRIKRTEYGEEHILRGRAVGQLEESPQPFRIGFAPEFHGFGIVTAADHRHERGDDDGAQRIPDPFRSSWVRKCTESPFEEGEGLELVVVLDL